MARKRKGAFTDEEAKQIEDAVSNTDNRKGKAGYMLIFFNILSK